MANRRHPQGKKSISRQTVHVGEFEQWVGDFRKGMLIEIGAKAAAQLATYHEKNIIPLQEGMEALIERLAWIETPWYVKVWTHIQAWWRHLRGTETDDNAEEPTVGNEEQPTVDPAGHTSE